MLAISLFVNNFFWLGSACLLNESKTKAQAWLIYKQTNINKFFIEPSPSCLWSTWFIYSLRWQYIYHQTSWFEKVWCSGVLFQQYLLPLISSWCWFYYYYYYYWEIGFIIFQERKMVGVQLCIVMVEYIYIYIYIYINILIRI